MSAPARRHVSIHLTPYAPRCEKVGIGDQRRWCAYWSVTPAQAVGELCLRLGVSPGALTCRDGPAGTDDIEILGPVADQGGRVLLALVEHGLTTAEIQTALEGLRARKAAA